MFTGIIEEVGRVRQIKRGQHSAVLTLQARTVLEHTKIGDSIAVNGICLTVTQMRPVVFPQMSCTKRWNALPSHSSPSAAPSIWSAPCLQTGGLADISWRAM